jgi:hypothetical protein
METRNVPEAPRSEQPPLHGIIPRLAGAARQTLPGPYHRLRMLRHQIRARRLKRVLDVVIAQQGLVVQGGPFQGMLYVQSVIDSALAVPRALGSALVPKLLGCYEIELQEALARILKTPYQEVVDIGSAEGYYAVGLAVHLPAATIYAYEMDPLRQQLCAEMARANGVADRVVIAGACTPEVLAQRVQGHPLIVCDCEGYELELLQPLHIPELHRCDLLVELHDSANPLISSTILERFAPSHEITRIASVEPDPAAYPVLASLSADDQRFAVSEERPAGMQWVFMQAKQAS